MGSGISLYFKLKDFSFFKFPISNDTKLGQNPLKQEKSLLQLDWSIYLFLPNLVSNGSIATQFDCSPQSPQPSQTSGLIYNVSLGFGKVPSFLLLLFSAAQVWI